MTQPTTPTGQPTTFAPVNRLEFAPNNAPDDPSPTWVDITQWVETQSANGGQAIEVTRGRQSELNIVESSQLRFTLKNFDNRFTFGYTAGPYGSNWAPAKQIRYSVILPSTGQQFVIFQGWIEYPDIPSWQPIGQQYVQVSALDRLTRLARGAPFVSTLGAHIMWAGRSRGLIGYWPLNDSPLFASRVGNTNPLSLGYLVGNTGAGPADLTKQATVAPPGDDTVGQSFTPRPTAAGTSAAYLHGSPAFTAATGQTVTISVWMKPGAPDAFSNSGYPLYIGDSSNSPGSGSSELFLFGGDANGGLVATIGANQTTIQLPQLFPVDTWRLVTGTLNLATGAMSLWVGSDLVVTGTVAGTPASGNYPGMSMANGVWPGTLAHAQVYVGASTLSYADHLAQFKVGMTGLAQQTTGQRINTLLDYAGVPSGPRQIDGGQSFMNAAKLAGQTPLQALQNASGTERGRLFMSGDGRVIFHDRVRVYNV